MYLTYSEYTAYGGALTEAEFNRTEYRAGKMLDKITHDRVRDESPVRECVKRTVFELIGKLHDYEQTASQDAAGISSKSNDGVSVVYADYSRAQQNRQSELMGIASLYLEGERDSKGVPLLYGGVVYDTLRT